MNQPYNFYHHASKNPPSLHVWRSSIASTFSFSVDKCESKKKRNFYNVNGIGDGCLDLPNSLGHNFEHDKHFIPFGGTSKEEFHKSNHSWVAHQIGARDFT
jgi:hypothetical protein